MHKRFAIPAVLICICLASLDVQGQTLGHSWRDQGMRALGSGDLDSARYYMEHWLEADPRDESSWYNLACIYALQGMREEALSAWESSVEAGWDDTEHPLQDSDLESIRDDPRFTDALNRISEENKSDGPEGYLRNFLLTTSVGTYIVALPPDYDATDRTYPLCVILHGSGSSETGHGKLADRFGRDGVIYIAPRAPYAHTSSFKGSGELGYTAWTPDEIDSLDALYQEVPKLYAEWIMECVHDARSRYRVSGEKTMILGHSQGAAFSFITAALYPDEIGSIYSYAGYFPDAFRTDERIEGLKEHGVRIRLAHGKEDHTVDPKETEGIAARLEESGIDFTVSYFDGATHFIAPDVMDDMTAWIDRETDRPASGTEK